MRRRPVVHRSGRPGRATGLADRARCRIDANTLIRRSPESQRIDEPESRKVSPKTPLAAILQLMLRARLNDVVVVDRKDRLLGIVTYADLSRRLLSTQQELIEHQESLTDPGLMEGRVVDIVNVRVEEIMTKKGITVSPQPHAIKAGAMMTARHVKQLSVVEAGKVVGIISHTDIGWGLTMRYAPYAKGGRTVG